MANRLIKACNQEFEYNNKLALLNAILQVAKNDNN